MAKHALKKIKKVTKTNRRPAVAKNKKGKK